MDLKRIALTVMVLLVSSVLAEARDGNDRVEYSAIQNLKNYALSTCIAGGYTSDEVVKDSSATAGGYLELGHLSFDAYEEAASLGKKFLAKEHRSKSGAKLTLMKCIDFFYSRELDRLAKKYSRE